MDCEVPVENRLGDEGEGFAPALAAAVGYSKKRHTREYPVERHLRDAKLRV